MTLKGLNMKQLRALAAARTVGFKSRTKKDEQVLMLSEFARCPVWYWYVPTSALSLCTMLFVNVVTIRASGATADLLSICTSSSCIVLNLNSTWRHCQSCELLHGQFLQWNGLGEPVLANYSTSSWSSCCSPQIPDVSHTPSVVCSGAKKTGSWHPPQHHSKFWALQPRALWVYRHWYTLIFLCLLPFIILKQSSTH